MTTVEAQLETIQPPDLQAFAELLTDPEYQPPEYIPAADQPGGFYAPDYGTPQDSGGNVRAVVRLDYVDHRKGWRRVPGLHCRYDDTGEPFVLDYTAIDVITARIGHRKVAADLFVNPFTGETVITGIHGVEPLYRGGPIDPNEHPRDMLVEGRVTEIIPAANLAAAFPNWDGAHHAPLMRVQLDPENPAQTVLVPIELIPDMSQPYTSVRPMRGDTVQVRTLPQLYESAQGPVVVPYSLQDAHYGRSETSVVVRKGIERTEQCETQQRETEALVAAITESDSPQHVARLVNTHFYGRYRYEPHIHHGVQEMSRLAITVDEVASVAIAVAAKGWEAHDWPAFLRPAQFHGQAYAQASEHRVGALYHMQPFLRDQDVLRDHESTEAMTVGQLGQLAERYAEQRLFYMDNPDEYGPPDYRLDSIFNAMDSDTTERTINAIMQHMQIMPHYRLFCHTTAYMVADMYHATHSDIQAQELIRLMCDAVRNEEDLINLLELEAGKNGDRLLTEFLEVANEAVFFEHEAARANIDMPIDAYLRRVETAQSVMRMLSVLGDGRDNFVRRHLRPEHIRIVEALDHLGT